ncbi:hypothetical protein Lal_00048355 [Lupinus albus]|nr:hypothetical protein Lal_00048355 [Lupinus albus]
MHHDHITLHQADSKTSNMPRTCRPTLTEKANIMPKTSLTEKGSIAHRLGLTENPWVMTRPRQVVT